jgi:CBS domain-containing protein
MGGYEYGPGSWTRRRRIDGFERGWNDDGYGLSGRRYPQPRPEPFGWDRPESNAGWSAYGRGPSAWPAHDEFDRARFGGRGDSPRGWRTGEPWGSGYSEVDRVTAREIMTEDPEAVTADASLAEAARRMRDLDVGIMPVVDDVDGYRLEGVITDRDIAVRAAAEGEDMTMAQVGKFMSRHVSTVPEHASMRDVFTVMKRERVRRVPVVDGAGRLVGIIAQADLAVDYAGLRPDREMEVEEVVERISERAGPGRRRGAVPATARSTTDSAAESGTGGI